MKALVLLLCLFSINVSANVVISGRIKIDTTTTTDGSDSLDIIAGDLFGYYIENIGDLDSDGVEDLAVSQYKNSIPGPEVDENGHPIPIGSRHTNRFTGRVKLLFMNADGSVKSSKDITQDDGINGVGAACVNGPGDSVESLAYLGNLINGNPTLAVGIPFNSGGSGKVIYIVELDTESGKEGDVLSCGRIAYGENGFNPGGSNSYFSFSLAATDVDDDGVMELIVNGGPALFTLFLNDNGSGGDLVRTFVTNTYADIGITAADDRAHSIRSVDGKRKLVVGDQDSDKSGDNVGSFHIVNLDTDGIYVSTTRFDGISLAETPNGNSFGSGVESLGDMDRDGVEDLLVSSESSGSGQAYIVFLNDDDSVRETQKISAVTESIREGLDPNEPSEALNFDNYFGSGVGLWRSFASHVVVGIGAHEDDTEGTNTGAMYLFTINRVTGVPPSFSQTISPAVISINGTVTTATVQFTIDNTVSAYPVESLSFTHVLPDGLEIATSNSSNSCGGALTANVQSTFITFTGGSLAANQICEINVDIVANGRETGALTGTSSALNSNQGSSGTSTATITVDEMAPVITLNGDATINLSIGDTFTDPGATAVDDVDGSVAVYILGPAYIDTSTPRHFTLTYTARDRAGNRGSATRTVNVIDPNAPPPPDPNAPPPPDGPHTPTAIPALGGAWLALLGLLVLGAGLVGGKMVRAHRR